MLISTTASEIPILQADPLPRPNHRVKPKLQALLSVLRSIQHLGRAATPDSVASQTSKPYSPRP